jgi:hypothetical protein
MDLLTRVTVNFDFLKRSIFLITICYTLIKYVLIYISSLFYYRALYDKEKLKWLMCQDINIYNTMKECSDPNLLSRWPFFSALLETFEKTNICFDMPCTSFFKLIVDSWAGLCIIGVITLYLLFIVTKKIKERKKKKRQSLVIEENTLYNIFKDILPRNERYITTPKKMV